MKNILFAALSLVAATVAFASNSVVVVSQADHWDDRRLTAAFEATLKQSLIKNGILVYDLGQLAHVKEKQLVDQLMRGDTEAAIQLGTAYKADWVIANKISSSLILKKLWGRLPHTLSELRRIPA